MNFETVYDFVMLILMYHVGFHIGKHYGKIEGIQISKKVVEETPIPNTNPLSEILDEYNKHNA